MMTPNELRGHLGLPALDNVSDDRMLLAALGSVSALVGEDTIEGHASWLDDLMTETDPTGVHIRVLVGGGVVTLDYEFDFDGAPDARFLPWSRVHGLHVIARPDRQTVISNAWLKTEDQDIEFAAPARICSRSSFVPPGSTCSSGRMTKAAQLS